MTLERKYVGLNAARFVLHPTLPYLYATNRTSNTVAIINTQTLALEATRALGLEVAGVDLVCVGNPVFPGDYDARQDVLDLVDALVRSVEVGELAAERLTEAAALGPAGDDHAHGPGSRLHARARGLRELHWQRPRHCRRCPRCGRQAG